MVFLSPGIEAFETAGLVGSTAPDAVGRVTLTIANAVTTILNSFTITPYSEIKVSLLLTVARPSANVAFGYCAT